MTSIGTALDEAVAALGTAGVDNPRAEARLLVAHVLDWSPTQVFSRPDHVLDNQQNTALQSLLSQRCGGMPLAHITGTREFWSLELRVTPATLIPRPDTETLIDLAVDLFKDRTPPENVLDLGTGSGCILLALLTCFPEATGVGIDISEDACTVARQNAQTLGLDDRCRIERRSWSDGLASRYDLIVSNPPYIPSGDIAGLATDVRDHEPLSALDGGKDGLDAYRALFPAAAQCMADDGILIVEIGIAQADGVKFEAGRSDLVAGLSGYDLAGIERAISFYKKGVGITGTTG